MSKKKIQFPFELNHGFIYPIIDRFLKFVNDRLCLVEFFKYTAKLFVQPKDNKSLEVIYCRMAVDYFIFFKWSLVVIFWLTSSKGLIPIIVVWYLIITNLVTYFYHHLWKNDLYVDKYFSAERIKRRFTTLILAIFFSIFAFAYLYAVPYFEYFSWTQNSNIFFSSMLYSIANSLTVNYGLVNPILETGYIVSVIQLAMMFVFFSVLLSGAIPQFNSINREKKNDIQE